MLNRLNGFLALGGSRAVFDPRFLFASGEKGVILLPENSDVAVGSGVGTVTDISGNSKNATQSTAGNKPILRQNATTGALYWEFDGTDDWLQTAAIDFTGTDKMTVFAAVRKLSDAATGLTCELGTDTAAVNGSFRLSTPGGGGSEKFGFVSRGTTAVNANTASATYNAPYSAVATGIGDISGDIAAIRVNGTEVDRKTTDQGTGNYGNLVLYVGRRAGATLPLNGHLYGLVIIGRACTATEIAATETFLNRRIGAY